MDRTISPVLLPSTQNPTKNTCSFRKEIKMILCRWTGSHKGTSVRSLVFLPGSAMTPHPQLLAEVRTLLGHPAADVKMFPLWTLVGMIGHIHTDQGFYARGLLRSLPPLIRRTTLTFEYETADVRTSLCSGSCKRSKGCSQSHSTRRTSHQERSSIAHRHRDTFIHL